MDGNGTLRLTRLSLSQMGLTGKRDVSGLDALEYLNYCRENGLTSLNASGCTKLFYLDCQTNRLTSLNVSSCMELKTLVCYNNRLTQLDVSPFKELVDLDCGENQLTSLNVSGCSKLELLDCADNNLTALDLSSCVKGTLRWLYCERNLLPSKAAVKLSFSVKWDRDDPDTGTFLFTPQRSGSTTTTTITAEPEKQEPRNESNRQAQEAAMNAVRDANSGKSTAKVVTATAAAGASVSAVSVKLYGLTAAISRDDMAILASGTTGLKVDLDNGAAEILIPIGFTIPQGSGMLAYPIGYQLDPLYSNYMKAKVKGPDAQSEVHRLGGGELPVAATVTMKTKVKGPVNVYYWNEDTWKISYVTSGVAGNGKVSFATKQPGSLIITIGTI